MKWRWHFAPGVDDRTRRALREAFRPDALRPFAGGFDRQVRGRQYRVLDMAPALPHGVFVKVFDHDSAGRRLRHAFGRSAAAQEFARALRLQELGVAMPMPLARVDEGGLLRRRRTYLLAEFVADARSLREFLEAPAGPEDGAFTVLADLLGRLLVDLANRGIWFRDLNCENVLVAAREGGGPGRIFLIDARHVEFRPDATPEVLEDMLVLLAGTLLAADADEALVTALLETAAARARETAPALGEVAPEKLLDRSRELARQLVARDVRKGKRPAAGLNVVADHYETMGDAANYRDRRFARSGHGRRIERAERRLVEQLVRELVVTGAVLDVPCGAGRFFPALGTCGARVVGVDISEPMLRLARRAADPPVPCLLGDARRLPFGDERFDLVLAMRLLHRVPSAVERVAVLKELARVSRQWVLFSFYNRRTPRGLRDWARGRYPGETRGRIAADIVEAGMRVERFVAAAPFDRQTLALCTVGR